MPEQCKFCERHEKRLKDLRERRTKLRRRGELTDATAKKLVADEQRLAEELEGHQVAQHGQSPVMKAATSAAESHPNLEEEIRHRAYELYEARGREDGHDIDDWLSAEVEIIASTVKARAA
jgi:DUF2934 family protein